MKINDVLNNDDGLEGIDYFVLSFDESDFEKLEFLEEAGIWKNKGQYAYMVHGEDPRFKQNRHVHIARKKHTNTKTKQVSWNDDGSRHDKKTFNSNLGNTKAVRKIASDVLDIDIVKLESMSAIDLGLDGFNLMTESVDKDLSSTMKMFDVFL